MDAGLVCELLIKRLLQELPDVPLLTRLDELDASSRPVWVRRFRRSSWACWLAVPPVRRQTGWQSLRRGLVGSGVLGDFLWAREQMSGPEEQKPPSVWSEPGGPAHFQPLLRTTGTSLLILKTLIL